MPDLLQYNPNIDSYVAERREGKIIPIDPDEPRAFARLFAPGSKRWWRKGRRPRRDSFRERAYDAERVFRTKVEFKSFANIAEVARYIRDTMEKPFFQRRFPLFARCEVRYGKRQRSCHGGPMTYSIRPTPWPLPDDVEVASGRITMTTFGMSHWGEVVALHELAHACTPAGHKHDRRWARTFIELIGCRMGFTAKKILMEEFRLRRIPFSPVRKANETESKSRRRDETVTSV